MVGLMVLLHRPHPVFRFYFLFQFRDFVFDIFSQTSQYLGTKERCVVEYITSHFPDFSWVADKVITDGCSRRRPDLLLDLGNQIIIVEVDENQHINYDCSCEHKRIMELSQDLNHRPVIFIRFNPDEYTDANGQDITSCWGVNGKGICVVKKSKKKEWESRLERLREQVEYWTNPANATEKTVEIVELFYDCE